ncbi:MAG: acetyl-CoA decarbonylase/synthase complex subunit gamma [Firmicutes bacterium]|nr:acetyl-CoA decarbonylase/synthase complex subunit gamma [Bacillota bacterium]
MALTGLEIYKLLPKKNCGKCGPPTCLAFAMQLAANKGSLDQCPDVTEEAKAALGAASAPPIRKVAIGEGDRQLVVGDETVLFRHDKTFFHETGIAIQVPDTASVDEIRSRVEALNKLEFERVGMMLRPNLVAVNNLSRDPEKFAAAVKVAAETSKMPLMIMTTDVAAMDKAVAAAAARKPLMCGANAENLDGMVEIAKKHGLPMVLSAKGLDDLAALSDKVTAAGHKEIILDPGCREVGGCLEDLTNMRRMAIRKKFRPLGFPTVAFIEEDDPVQAAADASVYIAKYASIIVFKSIETWQLLPLITLRQNIYTDPQKPIQVEAKVYEIGEVKPNSPVFITTNFSLTYFTVVGDIEVSKTPAYLLVVETDGTSVLTAWAAGKFTADKIAEHMQKFDVAGKVNHKKIILPGYVAVLSGKLSDLSGWEILVGPRESAGIPSFLKARWTA